MCIASHVLVIGYKFKMFMYFNTLVYPFERIYIYIYIYIYIVYIIIASYVVSLYTML